MKDKAYYYTLALSYFSGQITPEKEKELYEFVNAGEINLLSFQKWEADYKLGVQFDIQVSDSWDLFSQRLRKPQPQKRLFTTPYLYRVAAVFIILISVSLYLYYDHTRPVLRSEEWIQCFVPNGGYQKIILPDSTLIELNGGSILLYPANFNLSLREVYLIGEAWFDVQSDEKKNFLVKTPDFDVKVLGTSFHISNYAKEDVVTAFLEKGAIELELRGDKAGERVVLAPEEQFSYVRSSGKTDKIKWDPGKFLSWRKTDLDLVKMPLNELMHLLEKRFDLKIYLDETQYPDATVTAKFNRDEGPDEIMAVVKLLNPEMEYEFRDGSLYIY